MTFKVTPKLGTVEQRVNRPYHKWLKGVSSKETVAPASVGEYNRVI